MTSLHLFFLGMCMIRMVRRLINSDVFLLQIPTLCSSPIVMSTTLAPVSADLHPQLPPPSSLSLSGPQGDDCSISCPAGLYGTNCTSSCSCQNHVSCSHVDGFCVCKEDSERIVARWSSALRGSHKKNKNNNNNNNSEIKPRYTVEVIAVDMQGFYDRGSSVMLSSYCSLWIPTARVIPTRATGQLYASDIELIPGTFETIWDHFDKRGSIFHAFPHKYTHFSPPQCSITAFIWLYLASTISPSDGHRFCCTNQFHHCLF